MHSPGIKKAISNYLQPRGFLIISTLLFTGLFTQAQDIQPGINSISEISLLINDSHAGKTQLKITADSVFYNGTVKSTIPAYFREAISPGQWNTLINCFDLTIFKMVQNVNEKDSAVAPKAGTDITTSVKTKDTVYSYRVNSLADNNYEGLKMKQLADFPEIKVNYFWKKTGQPFHLEQGHIKMNWHLAP